MESDDCKHNITVGGWPSGGTVFNFHNLSPNAECQARQQNLHLMRLQLLDFPLNSALIVKLIALEPDNPAL